MCTAIYTARPPNNWIGIRASETAGIPAARDLPGKSFTTPSGKMQRLLRYLEKEKNFKLNKAVYLYFLPKRLLLFFMYW